MKCIVKFTAINMYILKKKLNTAATAAAKWVNYIK